MPLEINLNLSPKQSKAWEYLNDDHTTEIGYGGAAGGGKSYLGCAWVMVMCLSNPGVRYLLGRESLKNLKRTTVNTMFKVFADQKMKGEVHYSYNQQDSIFKFFNGSEIVLMDLSNMPSDPLFSRLGSLELTGGFVDESNECPYSGLEILKTRLGRQLNDKYNIKPKLLESFNPDRNHVYQRFYKPYKDGTLPDHRVFIPALVGDNPHLSQDYVNQLKNADEITKQRLLFGNFEYDDDPSKIFEYDSLLDMFSNILEQDRDLNKQEQYITVDPARMGQDRSVIGFWNGWDLKEIWVYDKNTIDQLHDQIEEIRQQKLLPLSHILIDQDGVGGGLVDFGKYKGFTNNASCIQPEEATWDETKKLNYANLKTQCYFMLAEKVNNHEIKVSDQTHKQEIIEDCQQIKQDEIDKERKIKILSKEKIKEMYGKSPDFSDMMMMRMYFELKSPPKARPLPESKNYIYNIPSFVK